MLTAADPPSTHDGCTPKNNKVTPKDTKDCKATHVLQNTVLHEAVLGKTAQSSQFLISPNNLPLIVDPGLFCLGTLPHLPAIDPSIQAPHQSSVMMALLFGV